MVGIPEMSDEELRVLVDGLTLYAARKINKLLWRGVKVDAGDFVNDAFTGFMSGTRHWDALKQPSFKEFLCGVIDSEVNHRVTRHDNAKVRITASVGAGSLAIENHLVDERRPDVRVVNKETTIWFQAAARKAVEDSDAKAKDVVECLLAGWERAQIAEYLGIEPTEVDAIRKRLQRQFDFLRREYQKRSKA